MTISKVSSSRVLDEEKWHYQVSSTQRFNLPGKYLVQLDARYTSASQNLIYYQQSSANTTASIRKKFFKDQVMFFVKLRLFDIVNIVLPLSA